MKNASRILGFLSCFKPAWSLIWWSQYLCTVVSGGGGKGCKRKVKHRLYNLPAVKRRFPEYHVRSVKSNWEIFHWVRVAFTTRGRWGSGSRLSLCWEASVLWISILISSWKRIFQGNRKTIFCKSFEFFLEKCKHPKRICCSKYQALQHWGW